MSFFYSSVYFIFDFLEDELGAVPRIVYRDGRLGFFHNRFQQVCPANNGYCYNYLERQVHLSPRKCYIRAGFGVDCPIFVFNQFGLTCRLFYTPTRLPSHRAPSSSLRVLIPGTPSHNVFSVSGLFHSVHSPCSLRCASIFSGVTSLLLSIFFSLLLSFTW